MDLREFVDSPYRNEWIEEPGLSYYVRKNLFFPGLITLANCGAPSNSNEFGLWRFLKRYATEIPFEMEQVLNPDLAQYMRRLKWYEYEIGGVPQFFSPLAAERFPGLLIKMKRYATD